jgi:hypothetical protein
VDVRRPHVRGAHVPTGHGAGGKHVCSGHRPRAFHECPVCEWEWHGRSRDRRRHPGLHAHASVCAAGRPHRLRHRVQDLRAGGAPPDRPRRSDLWIRHRPVGAARATAGCCIRHHHGRSKYSGGATNTPFASCWLPRKVVRYPLQR